MLPRNIADWDPVRDGSYIAALLDRAAEDRDLKRLEVIDTPKAVWKTRQTNLLKAAAPNLKASLAAP